MRVAIMQPTYLPWMGYFGLMNSVDLFILLDSVQFTKRSWQQRNQIKTAAGPAWLTVPVLTKGKRDQTIRDVEVDRTRDFPRNHEKTLELNYKKAPHFATYGPELIRLIRSDRTHLADLTTDIVTWLRDSLGISTPIRRSRELEMRGTNAEMLAALCEQVGATEYVSPPGSREYLERSDAFARRDIPVMYFNFIHPTYPQQFGDFVPYMSTADAVLNCGSETLALIAAASHIE